MSTLINNTNENGPLILKKVKVKPDTNKRLNKFRIKQIADTGEIVNVNDSLEYIIEKGLEAVGFPKKSA